MKKLLFLILTLMYSIILTAQNAGDIDQSFVTGSGFSKSGKERGMAIQTDGKIIIAGEDSDFYNGTTINSNIIRLNTDGTIDTSFITGTGFSSGPNYWHEVRSIAIQADGKIIVTGEFTSYNGSPAYDIIRLNTNGTIDTSFVSNIGFSNNSYIESLIIQGDGKIIIGGAFSNFNNSSANGIVRLNTNGTIDATFLSGTGVTSSLAGFDPEVISMVIQADGKIIIGGLFDHYDGNTANGIVRLNVNGTIDSSFISGTGVSSGVGIVTAVGAIGIQPTDGKIIIGGNFISYNGINANCILRLNTNGLIDTSFVSGAGFANSDFELVVSSLNIQTDGKITATGYFTSYNNNTTNRIVRINSNGSIDTSFNSGVGFDSRGRFLIGKQSNEKLIVSGDFSFYNGSAVGGIISLNLDGTPDTFFKSGIGFISGGSRVESLAIQPADGKIIVGGQFSYYNGTNAKGLVRINNNGTKDTSFDTGLGLEGEIRAIAIQSDGKIIIAGQIYSYNTSVVNNIFRLNTDGTLDPTFNSGSGFDVQANTIIIQPDGKIIIGGEFSSYNGVAANKIIRLNTNGSIDTTFVTGSGFNNNTSSIALQSNGYILVGGQFTNYNGLSSNSVIRLNSLGTKDTTFNIGSGFNGSVKNLLIQSDGNIIVTGNFNVFNGNSISNIIRLNTNGSIDTTFVTGAGFNNIGFWKPSLTQQNDGKIIAGGDFTYYNNNATNRIVRLNTNGSIDTSFAIGTGFNINNSTVISIAIQTDGKIIIGGEFTNYKSNTANGIIRLNNVALDASEFLKNALVIYPNPVKDNLHLSIGIDNMTISCEIFDLVGKKVLSKTILENQINLSSLSQGVYILKANTSEGILTKKFIKE